MPEFDRERQHDQQIERYARGAEKESRRRDIRAARKQQQARRNLKPKGRRVGAWTVDDVPDSWDDAAPPQVERVMPLDENERRQTIERAAARRGTARGAEQAGPAGRPPNIEAQRGLVTAIGAGEVLRVEVEGRELLCRVRGGLSALEMPYTNVAAVGDQVIVSEQGEGNGVVEAVLPRRSVLTRPDPLHGWRQQVIAANADQVLIVTSWREPRPWLELIDRYLIAAQRGGLAAVICINKADLIEDEQAFAKVVAPYRRLQMRLVRVSARTGEGLNTLREVLRDKTTVLVGLSGVGKSSLLGAVQPGLRLRVGAVSAASGEGRHTTTQSRLVRLAMGGMVADTPGIRELGLRGLRQRELAAFFPEIAQLSAWCRFADCVHLHEPDCAVRAGADAGEVPKSRYHSYRLIAGTLPV